MECLKIMNISAMAFIYGSMDLLPRKILCVILFCIFSSGTIRFHRTLNVIEKLRNAVFRVWVLFCFENIIRENSCRFAGNVR